jgi:F-type H+-transporting ATPase subunit b
MELINPDFGTIIWTTIAFLIVLLILKKFAWKPILNFLRERENSIENALKAADHAREEMSRLQADNEKILSKAKIEHDKILKEARALKESIVNEAHGIAADESRKLIEEARISIKNEKIAAMSEIKNQVINLSVEIAGKILHQKLRADEEQHDLIEKSLRDVKFE